MNSIEEAYCKCKVRKNFARHQIKKDPTKPWQHTALSGLAHFTDFCSQKRYVIARVGGGTRNYFINLSLYSVGV